KAVLVGASSCSTVDFDRRGLVPVYNVGACVTFIELNKITSRPPFLQGVVVTRRQRRILDVGGQRWCRGF
ncbi:hypothetical protein BpHYR1_025838, partial [Brachionus plicatilis]